MKKFLIQIQPGPRPTHWAVSDETLAELIQQRALMVVMDCSTGMIPAVTVTRDECACEMCESPRQPDAVRG